MTVGCLVGQDVPDGHQQFPGYSYRCNGLSSDAWGIIGCESDRVSQTVNGITTHYELFQAAGLTQVLSDGTNTYLYGVGRIAQYSETGPEYFLNDALGSVRQLVDANGSVTLARDYEPYGEALASAGSGATSYGYSGEMTDSYIKLIYLRSGCTPPLLEGSSPKIRGGVIIPDHCR
jgi:hypothetical protein